MELTWYKLYIQRFLGNQHLGHSYYTFHLKVKTRIFWKEIIKCYIRCNFDFVIII